jgi:hypothetical protein
MAECSRKITYRIFPRQVKNTEQVLATRIEFHPPFFTEEKNTEQVLLMCLEFLPPLKKKNREQVLATRIKFLPPFKKNREQVLATRIKISPAGFYGLKKYNHEVIEHILSVSVRKRGDLEITTKSYSTSFCSW